ncbi:MAG: AraC family transcriptional regulator [Tannerella sp.]|jgi:AraC-like DNA-binding protein|nr:AraC family transcriptional regulator [Tannerella sp.]
MQTYLKNPEKHRSCKYFFTESSSTFLLTEVEPNGIVNLDDPEYNHIIVVLEGRFRINRDEYSNIFGEGEIVFIPAYSQLKIEALEKSKLLTGTFEMPNDICTVRAMDALGKLKSEIKYTFSSIRINPPMQQYLDLLIMYLENGIKCAHLHDIKEEEIFLVFRWFYTEEEFVTLFYPIIGKALDFRGIVIKNYKQAKTVDELARIVGMSRSNFDAKFKDIFRIPPKQWMLKRKAQSIRHYMSKPDIRISDVMREYDFESFTQFNRFCRQQFGLPPSQLIKNKDAEE